MCGVLGWLASQVAACCIARLYLHTNSILVHKHMSLFSSRCIEVNVLLYCICDVDKKYCMYSKIICVCICKGWDQCSAAVVYVWCSGYFSGVYLHVVSVTRSVSHCGVVLISVVCTCMWWQ